MALPAYLQDLKFLESNLLLSFEEGLVREQKIKLERLLALPELKESEHRKTYDLLNAQLNAVRAFISTMEQSWEKEKFRKRGKL